MTIQADSDKHQHDDLAWCIAATVLAEIPEDIH